MASQAVSPARLREIATNLPGYVCEQIQAHADAWERDLADVDRFRKLARGYMDERDEAQRWTEEAAAAENSNAKDLRAALAEIEALHALHADIRRSGYLAGLEAAATLCERRGDPASYYRTPEEEALCDIADNIRRLSR